MWTHFYDMYSGGSAKESQENIFIEAPEKEAKVIFYNRFGHNPERVTCSCCGEDYSISEGTLQHLTGYHRHCDSGYISDKGNIVSKEQAFSHGKLKDGYTSGYVEKPKKGYEFVISIEDYIKQKDVLIITKEEIKPEERLGNVPTQGYVWMD